VKKSKKKIYKVKYIPLGRVFYLDFKPTDYDLLSLATEIHPVLGEALPLFEVEEFFIYKKKVQSRIIANKSAA
jgi:hypothetical protein